MEYSAIVAGTGFEGRDARIRAYARPGMPLSLKPEPDNPYDPNAIGVYITVTRWFTLFRPVEIQIGYIKRNKAEFLTRKMRDGGSITSAHIISLYTEQKHPRVSIKILTDW